MKLKLKLFQKIKKKTNHVIDQVRYQKEKNKIIINQPMYCANHPTIMLTRDNKDTGLYYCRKCKRWMKI